MIIIYRLKCVKRSNISVKDLFLNANAGFDIMDFHSYCYANDIFDNNDQKDAWIIYISTIIGLYAGFLALARL